MHIEKLPQLSLPKGTQSVPVSHRGGVPPHIMAGNVLINGVPVAN